MWAKLIVSVTLLPMLAHSIVGCCWHHAHSDGRLNCVHSTAESHAGHQHEHDHRSEHNDPVVPVPCEHNESCNDVHCVYLAAEPVRNALALGLNAQAATLDCFCRLIPISTVTASNRAQQCEAAPLPSQHCALTQVWVV